MGGGVRYLRGNDVCIFQQGIEQGFVDGQCTRGLGCIGLEQHQAYPVPVLFWPDRVTVARCCAAILGSERLFRGIGD